MQSNYFAAAFYDAVHLYATALNETLTTRPDLNVSTSGQAVIQKMWNRTFEGISGLAVIDENGDRHVDYALLDYNPTIGIFEVYYLL